MSKTNYKEQTERVVKVAESLNSAMISESVVVCLYALAFAAANLMVFYSNTGSPSIEGAAKVFYKDLMRNVKILEQSKADYGKAN